MNNPIKELVNRIVHRGLESFGRHYSSYRGFVLEDVDTTGMDKLFVYVPHISGPNKTGNWAYPKGKPANLTLMPKKGDMVWVEFEYGDYRYPIWSYCNQTKEIRQLTNPHHKPGDIKWKTEKGHHVLIDDTNDLIQLRHSNGYSIEINQDNIVVTTKEDGSKITINGDEIIFNGGDNGSLMVLSEVVSKINRLERLFNNHIHPVAGDKTAMTLTQITPLTKEVDLENPKVKH